VRLGLLDTPRGRRLLFAALYASEGAPIGYLWTALPTKLRQEGVPIEEVAALASLITLPWTLKLLWAPLVDALRSRRTGLRPWIVGAQIAMAVSLLPLFALDPRAQWHAFVACLLVHATCAATQDVAIDALAVKHVPPGERGSATAWMQVGMVLGRAAFGGVALMAERRLGEDVVLAALIGAIVLSSALAWLAGDAGRPGPSALRQRMASFLDGLRAALGRQTTWLGLGFVTLAGAGMEATSALAGPLLVDRGFDQEAIGRFFALPVVVVTVLGVLVGGRLSDRLPRVRVAGAALLAVGGSVGLVAVCAVPDGTLPPVRLLAALAFAYLLFGVLTAASYALMMDLTDPQLGGTQFSAYMGAVNLCYVWSAASAGRLAGSLDYAQALAILAGASLLGLALLPAISRRPPGPLPPRDRPGASLPGDR